MPVVAVVGSTIGGPGHGGTVISGSPLTTATFMGSQAPIARKDDQAVCTTHGPTTISTASTFAKDAGKFIARINDSCECGAIILTGADFTEVG